MASVRSSTVIGSLSPLDLPIKILFCDFAEQRDTSTYLHTKFARGQGADLARGFFALPHLARPLCIPTRAPTTLQTRTIDPGSCRRSVAIPRLPRGMPVPGVRHGAGARGCGAEAWMSELSKPRAHERSLIRTRTADGRIPAKLGGQVPAQPQTHAVPVERGPN